MSPSLLSWQQEKPGRRAASPTAKFFSYGVSTCKKTPSRLWIISAHRAAHLIKDSAAFGTLIGSAIAIHKYDPSHGRGPDLALPDRVWNSLGKGTTSILALYLCRLANLAQAAVGDMLEQNNTPEKIKSRIASILDTHHITRLLEDPPPQLFLAACLLFAFSIGVLRHSHKADIYLNRILVSGLILGSVAALQTTNVLMELKSYLAFSAILALLLSLFVHWTMRIWRRPHSRDNGPELVVKLHDQSSDRRDSRGNVVKVMLE